MRASKAIWATGAALAGAGALGSAAVAGIGTPPPAAAPILRETPPRLSASAVARFSFETKGRRVECRLDEGAARPCTSPVEYRVADGAHRFSVSAGGRAAHYAWMVDTSAPDAPRFTEAPGAVSGSTRVRFAVTPSAQCALDGVRVRCAALHEVAEGEHRFTAVAVDAAGNRSPETVHVWRVDTTPPAAPALADGGPPFAFTGEAGATFVCVLDGGPALPCSSPHAFAGPLPGGEHTFAVRARDAAGNTGPAATARFSVDDQPYRSAALASAPAGYWRLGETEWGPATALAGSPGAYVGGVTLGVDSEVAGDAAAEFDGTSGEVVLPGPTLRTEGTLSGWFRYSGVVALRDNTAGNGWILGLNSGGFVACRAGAGGAREARSSVPIAKLADGWHHLALTRSDGTLRCYLDGDSVATATGLTEANAPAAVLPWHAMNNGAVSEQYSRGRADEVAIHTRALTPEQIGELYRAGRSS